MTTAIKTLRSVSDGQPPAVFVVDTEALAPGNLDVGFVLNASSGSLEVYWGDGTHSTHGAGVITHTYASPGVYEITVDCSAGSISSFRWGVTAGVTGAVLIECKSFGWYLSGDMSGMFSRATNLVKVPKYLPAYTTLPNNMNQMFNTASSFNQDLSTWCVSLIPSEPTGFATNASSWVLPKPIWGTCPP